MPDFDNTVKKSPLKRVKNSVQNKNDCILLLIDGGMPEKFLPNLPTGSFLQTPQTLSR